MINVGYVEGTTASGAVVVRIYYDRTWLEDDPTRDPRLAPLIDQPTARQPEPRGWCLDITNTSGQNSKCSVTLPDGTPTTVNFGQGDPVTSGPSTGRSRTAAQMAQLGYRTRGDIAGFSIG